MTSPGGETPDGGLGPSSGAQGLADYAVTTEDDYRSQWSSDMFSSFNPMNDGFNLMKLVSQTIIDGIFGGVFGPTVEPGQPPTSVKPAISELKNSIDLLTTGDQKAMFTANGTWTKPEGAKRVTVHLIAGGSGGGKTDNSLSLRGAGSGGPGGWTQGYTFDAADLPATVAVSIGAGTAGATAVGGGTAATGGTTAFGPYLSVTGGVSGANGSTTGADGVPGTPGWGIQSKLLGNWGGISRGQYGSPAGDGVHGGDGPLTPGGLGGAGVGGSSVGLSGQNGVNPGILQLAPGSGGGGGGGAYQNQAGSGGQGGFPGGGGGGGGPAATGYPKGFGGGGGNGIAWIITSFA